MNKPLIFIGAGGHASVLVEAMHANVKIFGYCALTEQYSHQVFENASYFPSEDALLKVDLQSHRVVNGLGPNFKCRNRIRVFESFVRHGFCFETIVSPQAIMSLTARVGQGVQVLQGAVVQSGAWLLDNCVINTNSSVDHGAKIGRHVHVAPGAVICGDVEIGDGSFIGANATVLEGVKLSANSLIRAGEVVKKAYNKNGQ